MQVPEPWQRNWVSESHTVVANAAGRERRRRRLRWWLENGFCCPSLCTRCREVKGKGQHPVSFAQCSLSYCYCILMSLLDTPHKAEQRGVSCLVSRTEAPATVTSTREPGQCLPAREQESRGCRAVCSPQRGLETTGGGMRHGSQRRTKAGEAFPHLEPGNELKLELC